MKRKMLYIIVFAVSGHDGGSDEEKDVIYNCFCCFRA